MLALIEVSIMGNKIGKASIAVSVELLSVFEAIADTKVKVPEMPVLPKNKTQKKIPKFSMGLPNNKLKKRKLTKPITKSRTGLNINFEMIKA